MTQSSKEYDLEKIKTRVANQKEELFQWLKRSKRSTEILDTFVFQITLGEMDAMIKHIESLQSMVVDDWK